jgi:hypothetical protein
MVVEFLPQAKSELMDAVAYYEGELSGLGQRFWDEVDEHIAWIAENPDIPRLRNGGYRCVNLKIFPISTNTFFTKARGTTNTDVRKLKIRLYTTSLLLPWIRGASSRVLCG